MTLAGDLLVEVMDRPRRYVDRLQCHGTEHCGDCWWCREGDQGRYVLATGRVIDLSHGTRQAVTVIEPEPVPFCEEELARPWLRRCLGQSRATKGMAAKRVPWQKRALDHLDVLPPRYFVGGKQVGEWVYVDLHQAYPSIYSRLSLDMKWMPHPDRPLLGRGQMSLAVEPDLMEYKDMHRAVGGIIRSTQFTEFINGRPRTVDSRGWSKFLAPDLWGVIMWTLHSIARMAIDEFGAVMWDTDGGVMPHGRAWDLIDAIEDRWHLASRIEHKGPGTVWGVKHWDIGDDSTKQGGRRRVLPVDDRVLRPSRAIVECLQGAVQ